MSLVWAVFSVDTSSVEGLNGPGDDTGCPRGTDAARTPPPSPELHSLPALSPQRAPSALGAEKRVEAPDEVAAAAAPPGAPRGACNCRASLPQKLNDMAAMVKSG